MMQSGAPVARSHVTQIEITVGHNAAQQVHQNVLNVFYIFFFKSCQNQEQWQPLN